MTALLGLFLFSQINTTLAALASVPDAWRYAGHFGLILLSACLLFAVGRAVIFYFRLRSNRPVSLKGLEQLAERTRLRWLVHEKKSSARQYLVAYLQAFMRAWYVDVVNAAMPSKRMAHDAFVRWKLAGAVQGIPCW